MKIPSTNGIKNGLQKMTKLITEFKFTSGELISIAVSITLFISSNWCNISADVFRLGTDVVVSGHVHKLLTYSFFHEDVSLLLLSIAVLMPFSSSLEKSVGTVRFLYLLLLLSALTGLLHTALELMLFAAAERSHVQGFVPASLSLMGMATMQSRMRRALLLGVNVPVVCVPWILLLITLFVPGTVILCNVIAVVVGELFGRGWFSVMDMSMARASVLDKKMPFRLLRRLGGVTYVPASAEERRKTLYPPCYPAPGSYPVQAYAPASSIPPKQAMVGLPQMYEGWQHSTHTQGSYHPPSFNHGQSHGLSHGHSHGHNLGHGLSHSHWPTSAAGQTISQWNHTDSHFSPPTEFPPTLGNVALPFQSGFHADLGPSPSMDNHGAPLPPS